jgi:hypothetical protein
MSKYLTKEARANGMKAAAAMLDNAATAIGGSTAVTEDVVRVRNAKGSTILSLYAPNYWGSPRWVVTGDFVPVAAGRRWSNRRTFWRGDAVKAAQEALQYVRGQTRYEQVVEARDRALRADDTPYRGPKPSDLPRVYGAADAFAVEAYLSGLRSADAEVNVGLERLAREHHERLSDKLWDQIIKWSFAPELEAATV